ncbi:MAG: hypothetical protein AB1346_09770 [Thermodesulfobacteriota bacterium]
MSDQGRQFFIEKSLPELQKSFKAEFVENKLVAAMVGQEELSFTKYKARIGNVNIQEPSVEVSGNGPFTIKVTDFQGTWLYNYPR